jgi:multidrug efflux pump subunit AcrA (membrane-fusion protein)
LRSLPNQVLSGQVKRVDFQSDPVTLERVVYIGFDQPLKQAFLKEQAKVQILTRTLPKVATLPNTTLSYYQGKQGIWWVQRNKAQFSAIEFLAANDHQFAFNTPRPAYAQVIKPDKNKKPLYNGANVYHD